MTKCKCILLIHQINLLGTPIHPQKKLLLAKIIDMHFCMKQITILGQSSAIHLFILEYIIGKLLQMPGLSMSSKLESQPRKLLMLIKVFQIMSLDLLFMA